ncbi:MAG: xylulokinase [Clostridiales Family XIII bacterium]|jgi:xylulokinase|nr:xylulokinase [Clostridiales Family XIII bacterium]
MKYLIGIDIGTSGTKTVIFNDSGSPIASKTVEYPMYQPHNGWAEQDPEDWWRATVDGLRAVLAKSGADAGEIAGVGLSGQMHGLVMLDSEGRSLRPSIIWCDQRTGAECEYMNRVVGEKRMIEITANPPMTGFTASKILWVQKNEPDVYERCAHILLPKDYIRYRLTGEFATEVSDASGMQLMDVGGRCWSGEVLEKLGIDRSLLAKMYESPDVTGQVHGAAASETGLAAGTPVVGGAGDNPAAAVGTGVVSEGTAFTTIGTSAVVYAVSDSIRIDMKGRVHSLCASVPGKWTVMSCTQGAGLSLKWLRDTCCAPEIAEAGKQGVDPYEIMTGLAAEIPIGSEKLLFLPYLMGERSPHPDPDCRGVFFGLSAIHKRSHLIRSVLEGVAFSQLECVDVFREMGVPVSDMTVTGGGGRSPLWRQMLADLYGCPVNTLTADEGGALGVALLAGVGAGVFASVEQACTAVVRKTAPLLPDAAANEKYMPYFELYKELYLRLKDAYKTLANISG